MFDVKKYHNMNDVEFYEESANLLGYTRVSLF